MTPSSRRDVWHLRSTCVVPEATTGATLNALPVDVAAGSTGIIVGVHDLDHLVVDLDVIDDHPRTVVVAVADLVVEGRRRISKERNP